MSTISSPGIGSGLDVTTLVEGLVGAEIDPQTALLDVRETEIDADISAFGELSSVLSTVSANLVNLQTMSDFEQRSASSDDEDVVTASATSSAETGEYDINVIEMAQAQVHITRFGDATNPATGTSTITEATSDSITLEIAVDGGAPTQIVVAGGTTLNGLVNTINNANTGVTASLITGLDMSGNQIADLVLTSDTTGLDSDFTVEIANTPSPPPYTSQVQTNISFFSGETGATTITGGVAGSVTLDIDVNGGGPTSVIVNAGTDLTTLAADITAQVADITASVQTDADGAYLVISGDNAGDTFTVAISGVPGAPGTVDLNDVLTSSSLTSSVVPTFDLTNLTLTDPMMADVRAQNARITINGGGDIYSTSNTLTDNIDGVTLTLEDTGTATVSVTNDTSSVTTKITDFVTSLNEAFTKISELTDYDASTQESGVLIGDPTVRGLESRLRSLLNAPVANLTGTYTSLSSIGITTNDDGTISLDSATLSSALSSNFEEVARLFVRGGFASDQYITVESTSVAIDAGVYSLTIDAPYVPGVSLSGTIEGVSATSSDGFLLEGSSTFLGLSMTVNGGSDGSRGTVTIFEGVGVLFEELIDSYINNDTGVLTNRVDTLGEQSTEIDEERADLALRKLRLEDRYFRQFAALDVVLAQLQITSNFLTQQLANLPSVSSNNNK